MSEILEVLKYSDADNERKADVLEDIVSFSMGWCGTSAYDSMKFARALVMNLPTIFTIATNFSPPIDHDLAEKWLEGNGKWRHGCSDRLSQHNELGMAFAQWATDNKRMDKVSLGDSPDIRGKIGEKMVRGDIGKCTANAFLEGVKTLSFHDLWISVLAWDYQVIIEFMYSPAIYIAIGMSEILYGDKPTLMTLDEKLDLMKKAFYCQSCDMWSIEPTKDNAERVWPNMGVVYD